MPEQEQVGQAAPEWTQESVEKQAAEIEKQAETPPEPKSEEPEVKEKIEEKAEKVVPLQALHEERARRREEKQRAQMLEQQLAQLAAQQQQLLARFAQPQVQTPDPATDPLGAMSQGIQRTQAELQQIRQEQWQDRARAAQEQQYQQYVATVKAQEAEFSKVQPDYLKAVDFAKSARMKEYQAMGLSPEMAQQRVLNDEHQLVQWAFQNGENPAKVAFEWAQARGYVPASKKLEMQREGQQTSTPSGGGGKGGGDPSLEALLKMSPQEFAKATSGDNWARLMKKHGA